MKKLSGKGVLRAIDANFNRSKEGLRVIEDIFRFITVNDRLRRRIRKLRHQLDKITSEKILTTAILTRDAKKDIGREVDSLEAKRSNVGNILYANLQRVKESLRVLEEFLKLATLQSAVKIKKMRYEIYTIEKEIIKKWPPLPNPRQRSN